MLINANLFDRLRGDQRCASNGTGVRTNGRYRVRVPVTSERARVEQFH
jgi:hypothetical protein